MKSQVNISLQKEVMKIALIMVKGNVYGFKNRSFIFKYMPDSLTLGTLYGIIKHSFPEIEVEIYDETVETLKKENIKADLIGISAITCAHRDQRTGRQASGTCPTYREGSVG